MYSKFYFFFEIIRKYKYIKYNYFFYVFLFGIWSLLCSLRGGSLVFSEFSRLPFYILLGLTISNYLKSDFVNLKQVMIVLLILFYTLLFIIYFYEIDGFKATRYFEFANETQILELDDVTTRFSIGNPTSFSITLLLISFFIYVKGKSRFLLTTLLLFTFFLAGSRSVLFGFLIFLFFQYRLYRVLFAFFSVLSMIFFSNFSIENRIVDFGNKGDLLRLSFYETFFSSFNEYLFLGKGAGSFINEIYIQIDRKMSPESLYIDLISSYGFVLTMLGVLFHFRSTGTKNLAYNITLLLLGILIPLHNYFLFWVFIFTQYNDNSNRNEALINKF